MTAQTDLESWYVAYTLPNCEKKIFRVLESMGITSFLPLRSEIRHRKDRKKILEVPIFPNYIFIRLSRKERYRPLQIKEVIRYVEFDGQPAVIQDSVIDTLKRFDNKDIEVSNDTFHKVSMPIRIEKGPFTGTEGVLVRKNGRKRLLIRIECLNRTISIDVSADMVAAI